LVRFDHEKNGHIVNIKFKLPLVKDNIKYKNPDDKGKYYTIRKGKEELQGNLTISKGRRANKNSSLHHHSTMTTFLAWLNTC